MLNKKIYQNYEVTIRHGKKRIEENLKHFLDGDINLKQMMQYIDFHAENCVESALTDMINEMQNIKIQAL